MLARAQRSGALARTAEAGAGCARSAASAVSNVPRMAAWAGGVSAARSRVWTALAQRRGDRRNNRHNCKKGRSAPSRYSPVENGKLQAVPRAAPTRGVRRVLN